MNAVQLEFNLEGLGHRDYALDQMQGQIDGICTSTDKVRRRLFAELGEVKRQVAELKLLNFELTEKVRILGNEKTRWDYEREDCLFDLQGADRAVCG